MLGCDVIVSGIMPTNLGGGTNETRIIAMDARDLYRWKTTRHLCTFGCVWHRADPAGAVTVGLNATRPRTFLRGHPVRGAKVAEAPTFQGPVKRPAPIRAEWGSLADGSMSSTHTGRAELRIVACVGFRIAGWRMKVCTNSGGARAFGVMCLLVGEAQLVETARSPMALSPQPGATR
jgi:hypothetical protein